MSRLVRLRNRLHPLAALLSLTLILSFTSCAYYNTFYHARRYYKQAEKSQQAFLNTPGSKDTRSGNLYKQSIEKCQKVIDKYPGSKWQDDAHLLMAKAYYGRADYLNAKKTLKKFDDSFADSDLYPEAKFWRGKTAYAQGEYPEARQVWTELLAEYPKFKDREEVEFLLAESEWQAGHNDKAEAAFEAYLAAYPGGEHAADTRIDLGRVYLDNGEFVEAEEAFKEVAEHGKEKVDRNEARMLLGETMELQGRNDEALRLYNELAEDLDPAVYKWRMSQEELAILRQTELATAAEEAAALAVEAAYQDSIRKAEAPPPDSLGLQSGMDDFARNTSTNNQQARNQDQEQKRRAEAQRQAQRNLQRRRDVADPIDQQIAQILLREGGVTAKLGRPLEAIEVYEQVVIEFPRTPYASEAQYRIGYTFEVLLEDFDEARNAYVDVSQHGVSSFREDAARRAKNLTTVAALLAQSASDSLSEAESAAAEARFMRAELYLFQQESPEKALAEYRRLEQEFPETEYAAKAGLAVAWVTSHSLGDTVGAMEKYAEVAAAYPNTEYGRRAGVMVYGPEKDPEPEEFAGPSVDELRAAENLAAIALMHEAEAAEMDSAAALAQAEAQEAPVPNRQLVGNVVVGGTVARVGAGGPPRQVPGDGSLSSAVKATPSQVAAVDTTWTGSGDTNSQSPEPTGEAATAIAANTGEATGDATEGATGGGPDVSAAGVAALGAATVGAGILAGGLDTPPVAQEPMRLNDPSPTMAPVEAEAAPLGDSGESAISDDGGSRVNPVAAGAVVGGVAASSAISSTSTSTDTPATSSETSTGAPATSSETSTGPSQMSDVAPIGTPPTSPGPLADGEPNPMILVGGVVAGAGMVQTSPGPGEQGTVPGALMRVPRGLYLDPLAVPEDGPSPVKGTDTITAANKNPTTTPSKTTTANKLQGTEQKAEKQAPEKQAPEKKDSEKKDSSESPSAEKKETEKAKEPEQKEPEKTPDPRPDPGANP